MTGAWLDVKLGYRMVIAVLLSVSIGLLACVVPAARGLRIQPIDALRQRG
jgi:ABC-type antimicrobial peptide transport system permease subunit